VAIGLEDEVKSPLRYPGGKSRAVSTILPLVPRFHEYREPLVGGGSMFIALKQRARPGTIFKINDLNNDLYCFWKVLRDEPDRMITKINEIMIKYHDVAALDRKARKMTCKNDYEKAVRFFVINRLSFSGLSDSGGYSGKTGRWTSSAVERLKRMKQIMKDIVITNEDYNVLLQEEGDDVFVFLDPPYYKAGKRKLYGKDGDLHATFDHDRFADDVKQCRHKWLVTYDDVPEIRDMFSFAEIHEWKLQYGMNNYMQKRASTGKELIITNYEIPEITGLAKVVGSSRERFKSLDEFIID
jgi:DNA adenine methylase